MQPDLCNADELVDKAMRQHLAPPPMVAPGDELQHLVREVFLLREALRLLAADVAALRRHRIE